MRMGVLVGCRLHQQTDPLDFSAKEDRLVLSILSDLKRR
jgi:hypothetical protein